MGIQDALHYAFLSNPISTGAAGYVKSAVGLVKDYVVSKPQVEVRMVQADPVPLWKLAAATGPFVRLAALSGATAVILGAYGSHKQYPKDNNREQQRVFETASRYHFIHTLALLGLPMCRAPFIAGIFMLSGMVMFCGTCYYYAFTGEKRFSRVTPIGGMCFILGWLGMLI
ncbi:transmembrane protein 256 homolog [Cephus cinctus]|uniref:Transmembrane protein 256 homolog n=1 Tax=Cephus cinctus TaxID=211228 RepID=A0AAJ7RUA1_CEPCN|nr:transmembrane protein 256 homolog [Cephus cinctus]XP_024947271.1 transmembrane protein 256 homolog [Cephus cinctus]